MAEISFIRQPLSEANPLAEEQVGHNLYLGTKFSAHDYTDRHSTTRANSTLAIDQATLSDKLKSASLPLWF
jgi:hypothetical protein